MLLTSGDELLCKFVVCVGDASLLVGVMVLVVSDYVLYLVQRDLALRRDVSRLVTLMTYESVTCSPARVVG